ncbi:hypothetical protein [Pseudoalteromonas luteoviolacea]|uniref:Uncharacterized protein n=1 Tax=Pseudoalteromonas luteoviolacea (strain 2ta16) TaxID=1353533 RepID=V4HRA1_PSEL2|nr:hypothetical protein [Pseudoalteromonas luteoviolacea]ESP93335.1 hypothetical protein PL2TA16_03557 [Pseudoalteromonas luteoviolacea 2ta16]KZN32824.1 hypothetical protein N483_26565 [Pseudoalteromonas luteoviolacea NCIMB 1944]
MDNLSNKNPLNGGYGSTVSQQEPALMIYSIGFEFQSSDLFPVTLSYATNQALNDIQLPNDSNIEEEEIDNDPVDGEGFVCSYATCDDIPEGTFVDFSVRDHNRISLTLDAVGPSDEHTFLREIDPFYIPEDKRGMPGFIFLDSDFPLDTEFHLLNTNTEDILSFNQSPFSIVLPSKLLQSYYEHICDQVLIPAIRNMNSIRWHAPYMQNATKYNVFRFPSDIEKNDQTYFGFIQHAFLNSEAERMSFVPQVTIECNLRDAFLIVNDLLTNTSIAKEYDKDFAVYEKISESIKYVERMFGPAYQQYTGIEAFSFVFLLHQYWSVIVNTGSSKQYLGIALRHLFLDVFSSLSGEEQQFIKQNKEVMLMLDQVSQTEPKDGICRFPYNKNKKVLIEYRLFNYLVSVNGMLIIPKI